MNIEFTWGYGGLVFSYLGGIYTARTREMEEIGTLLVGHVLNLRIPIKDGISYAYISELYSIHMENTLDARNDLRRVISSMWEYAKVEPTGVIHV